MAHGYAAFGPQAKAMSSSTYFVDLSSSPILPIMMKYLPIHFDEASVLDISEVGLRQLSRPWNHKLLWKLSRARLERVELYVRGVPWRA